MSVEQARSALARGAWAEALELVSSLDNADALDVTADASWWLGRLDDCIEARAAAYAAYEADGDQVAAGQCAVWLWEHHIRKPTLYPLSYGGWGGAT
jgi:hypothetical protein